MPELDTQMPDSILPHQPSSSQEPLLVEVESVLVVRRLDLAGVRILQIGLDDIVPVLSDGSQTSLLHDRRDNSTTQRVVSDNQTVEIDLGRQRHIRCDGCEDQTSLASVSEIGELDLSVQSSRTEKSWIEGIGSVGGHDDLDVGSLIEPIHLVEQLQQNSLHFSVGTSLGVESLCGNSVDLVDEDDRWGILASHAEYIANHTGTFSQVLLYELGSYHSNEVGCRRVRNRLHQHGLSCSWGAVQKNTSRWIDTDLLVEVEMCERKLNSFPNLLLLHIQTTDIRICDIWLLIRAQHSNRGVSLGREDIDK